MGIDLFSLAVLGIASLMWIVFHVVLGIIDNRAYRKAIRGDGFYEGRGCVIFPTNNLADRPLLKAMAPKAYAIWKEQHDKERNGSTTKEKQGSDPS